MYQIITLYTLNLHRFYVMCKSCVYFKLRIWVSTSSQLQKPCIYLLIEHCRAEALKAISQLTQMELTQHLPDIVPSWFRVSRLSTILNLERRRHNSRINFLALFITDIFTFHFNPTTGAKQERQWSIRTTLILSIQRTNKEYRFWNQSDWPVLPFTTYVA